MTLEIIDFSTLSLLDIYAFRHVGWLIFRLLDLNMKTVKLLDIKDFSTSQLFNFSTSWLLDLSASRLLNFSTFLGGPTYLKRLP
jgi:hypothetical protein